MNIGYFTDGHCRWVNCVRVAGGRGLVHCIRHVGELDQLAIAYDEVVVVSLGKFDVDDRADDGIVDGRGHPADGRTAVVETDGGEWCAVIEEIEPVSRHVKDR